MNNLAQDHAGPFICRAISSRLSRPKSFILMNRHHTAPQVFLIRASKSMDIVGIGRTAVSGYGRRFGWRRAAQQGEVKVMKDTTPGLRGSLETTRACRDERKNRPLCASYPPISTPVDGEKRIWVDSKRQCICVCASPRTPPAPPKCSYEVTRWPVK
jgi:hypothetical protein